MQYQSFVRFLEYCHIDYQATAQLNIPRLKKQVVAEFAMEPSGIITIDGVSYNKHDVQLELGLPEFARILEYHVLVWKHKELLDLLEKDKMDPAADGQDWYYLHAHHGFADYLSPYFAPRFDSRMKRILQEKQIAHAVSWMYFLSFVTPYDEETALRSSRFFLEESIKLFRNLNDKTFRQRSEELAMWHQQDWSDFINVLPDSLLHYTDELADTVINFTVRIQKASRKICYQISNQLTQLETVSYTTRQLIRGNHIIYKKNYEQTTWRGRLRKIPSVYFLVILVLALLRGLSADSCNSGNKRTIDVSRLAQQEVTQKEIRHFAGLREKYLSVYRKNFNKGAISITTDSLKKIPFFSPYLYLLIEQNGKPEERLFPVVLFNKTGKSIPVYILRSDEVIWFDVSADKSVVFEPSSRNLDMILNFGNKDNALMLPEEFNERKLEYVHLSNNKDTATNDIPFSDSASINLPYLEDKVLHQQPLVITVTERNGNHYYTVKGNVSVNGWKTL